MDSIWSKTCSIPSREPLEGNVDTEIAVIGAGMCGILTASLLQSAGRRVVVLEANRIASGQTRNTTAKITAQHGCFAKRLIDTLGMERARQYVHANMNGVTELCNRIKTEQIDCDLEMQSSFVYGDDEQLLAQEAEAQVQLGLKSVLVSAKELPGAPKFAIRVDGQAQFHPLRFLKVISAPLKIFEQTSVQSIHGRVLLTNCGTVRADRIVFACHYPFVNIPGFYFARMHQERSYVLALENAACPDGMWIGAAQDGYSFRRFGELLLLGGGGHRTGENRAGGRYDMLRAKARAWFPRCREAAHWSAQDCITADEVPYIGRFSKTRPNWYIASGFRKWGMSTSMVAASLLSDLICGKNNPCSEVFDPGRFDLEAVVGIAEEGAQAIKGLTRRIFRIPKKATKLHDSRGGIVNADGKKCGVYQDPNGGMHAVNVRCPHLGCQVEWNPDEKSWDCPCHGSRFDCDGKLISGPAQANLRQETINRPGR